MNALLLGIFGSALLYLAIVVPLILVGGVLHTIQNWWRRRPRPSLADRNQFRASAGAFLMLLAAGLWAYGLPPLLQPIGVYALAGVAGFGLLWLLVGVLGSQGTRFDWMRAIYLGVVAVGCAALLFFEGIF